MTDDPTRQTTASAAENGGQAQNVCACHRAEQDEAAFWEELDALLIQMACLVERHKLKRIYTTSDLRRAGKQVLCGPRQS